MTFKGVFGLFIFTLIFLIFALNQLVIPSTANLPPVYQPPENGGIIGGAAAQCGPVPDAQQSSKEDQADKSAALDNNLIQITLTFGGDCTLGRGQNFSYHGSFDEMYDLKGASYFFSGIEEFFNDDLTMVNLEGPLTNAICPTVKTFAFKGRPEYAKILTAGSIDLVTVANNHSMDYLKQGFEGTIQSLSPYVTVSGYDRMPIVTVKGVKIGFASNVGWVFGEAQKQFIKNAVQSLKTAGADLVVFNYHWGAEGARHRNATQRAIAHYCIDQGGDLVIGHHPHVVQETETYKGKHIAYSLGNLVFGGNQNPRDKNCLIYRASYSFDLISRTVASEIHAAIPYLVSSVASCNNYHPVRAG